MSQLEILTIDKNFELVYMSVRYTLGSSLIGHDNVSFQLKDFRG